MKPLIAQREAAICNNGEARITSGNHRLALRMCLDSWRNFVCTLASNEGFNFDPRSILPCVLPRRDDELKRISVR